MEPHAHPSSISHLEHGSKALPGQWYLNTHQHQGTTVMLQWSNIPSRKGLGRQSSFLTDPWANGLSARLTLERVSHLSAWGLRKVKVSSTSQSGQMRSLLELSHYRVRAARRESASCRQPPQMLGSEVWLNFHSFQPKEFHRTATSEALAEPSPNLCGPDVFNSKSNSISLAGAITLTQQDRKYPLRLSCPRVL